MATRQGRTLRQRTQPAGAVHQDDDRRGYVHDPVTVNIIASLGNQPMVSGCRLTTDEIALRTSIATLERSNITIKCGERVHYIYESRAPRPAVEVL